MVRLVGSSRATSISATLNFLPLTDPFVLLQSLLARQWPEKLAWTGLAIVPSALFAGRWPQLLRLGMPVNLLTDLALAACSPGHQGQCASVAATRYWMLGGAGPRRTHRKHRLGNGQPVSMMHRGLIFGLSLAWAVLRLRYFSTCLSCAMAGAGTVPGWRLLQPDRPLFAATVRLPARDACNDCMIGFRRPPGAAGDSPGTEVDRRHAAGHSRGQLHQLRPLCIVSFRRTYSPFGTRFNTTAVPVTGVPHAAPK